MARTRRSKPRTAAGGPPPRPEGRPTREPAARRPARKVHRTRKWWPRAGYAVAGAVVVVGLFLLLRPSGPSATSTQAATVSGGPAAIGEVAPDFTARGFDGSTLRLSNFRGKAVLINFFASWCTVCRQELPAIQDAYAAHRSQGFAVLGVNTQENGDGPGFYRQMGLTFPAVYDPGQPGNIGAAYNVTAGLPASIFVDRQGRIDLIVPGAITTGTIESELQKLL
jgi:cytochrome c biogenesis protein CcmG, thiol:disulfide interchange protein DsbE